MLRYRCDSNGCKKYIKKTDKTCPYCGGNKIVYYSIVGGISRFAGDKLKNARDLDNNRQRAKRLGHIEEYQEPKEVVTFQDLVDNYYMDYYRNKNNDSEPRAAHLNYFKGLFSNKDIRNIKYEDILKAIDHIGKTKAPSTRNRYLNTIKGIFTCAIKLDMIDKHPVRISANTEDNGRIRVLSTDEEERLSKPCQEANIYNAFMVGLYTGMRRGELLTLSKDDIIDGKIHLQGKSTKTKKGRIIPIHDKIKEFLQGDFSFRTDFARYFSEIATSLGMDDVTFHVLRHTFASRLVAKGVDLYTVSKLMGHKSIKTTQRYAHFAPNYFEGIIDKL